jgi:hypothetical protein
MLPGGHPESSKMVEHLHTPAQIFAHTLFGGSDFVEFRDSFELNTMSSLFMVRSYIVYNVLEN